MCRTKSILLAFIIGCFGCQSTCSTGSAPNQKPPLGQRLFGTTQKPTNCPTCPPPGLISAPQPPIINSQPAITGSTPPIGVSGPVPQVNGMAPPAIMSGPTLGMAPPPAPVTANKAIVPPAVALGAPETSNVPTQPNRQANQTGFPVDIPGYAVLSEKIAGGHQPFPDGITWLKEAGFSTVIHLRSNADEVAVSRQLVERQGLAYKSLEVSTNSMDSSLLATIDRDIQSANGRPVFIFDRDGTRTGAMWIAYSIRYMGVSESQAREQAARLGYRKETADPAWESAITNLIKNR